MGAVAVDSPRFRYAAVILPQRYQASFVRVSPRAGRWSPAVSPVFMCYRFGTHIRLDDPKMKATSKDIWKQFTCLWHFVTVEGVGPTNNASERDIRPAVIARGLMLSTKSEAGRLLFTRLLSVSSTCRKQGRNLLDYLKFALDQHARNLSAPTLVPG